MVSEQHSLICQPAYRDLFSLIGFYFGFMTARPTVAISSNASPETRRLNARLNVQPRLTGRKTQAGLTLAKKLGSKPGSQPQESSSGGQRFLLCGSASAKIKSGCSGTKCHCQLLVHKQRQRISWASDPRQHHLRIQHIQCWFLLIWLNRLSLIRFVASARKEEKRNASALDWGGNKCCLIQVPHLFCKHFTPHSVFCTRNSLSASARLVVIQNMPAAQW